MKKQITSVCLLLAMIMSMTALFAMPVAAEATYVMDSGAGVQAPAAKLWDGTTATAFAGGTGTEEDPFQISCGAELAHLMTLSDTTGLHFVLTDDIWLNDPAASFKTINEKLKNGATSVDTNAVRAWTPSSITFQGVFDGQGHTIYGLFNSGTSQQRGLFQKMESATLKNLNIAYSAVASWRASAWSGRAALFAIELSKDVVIQNCHAYHCGVYGNNHVGGFVVLYGENSLFDSCTFSGYIGNFGTRTDGIANIGGLIGHAVGTYKNGIVRNCAMYGEIANYGTNADAQTGAIMSIDQSGAGMKIFNTVNYANIVANGDVGGISSRCIKSAGGGDKPLYIVNCANYGDLTSLSGGSVGGAVSIFNTTNNDNRLFIQNFANYGTVTAYGEGEAAGGVIGLYTGTKLCHLYNILSLGTVQAGEGATGVSTGGVVGSLIESHQMKLFNAYANGTYLKYDAETGTAVTENATVEEAVAHMNANLTVPSSLQQPLVPLVEWVGSTGTLTAASLTLSDSLAINLYATEDTTRPALVFEAGLILDDGSFGGLKLTAKAEKVNKGGVNYLHFVLDDITPADIDETYDFYLPHARDSVALTYSVLDYITRKYQNNSSENLDALLEAILHYGHAAEVAKGETPSILDAFKEATGADLPTFEEAYAAANVNLAPEAVTFPEGVAISLQLADGIIPVIYVNNNAITKVSYTCYGDVTEQDVAGETYVVVDKLVATSLNNIVTITFTVDGQDVTTTWNVANFISAATAENGFTAEQVNLARALALYMTTARAYKGLKN